MNIQKDLAKLVLSLAGSLVLPVVENDQNKEYYGAKRKEEVRQEYYYSGKKPQEIYKGLVYLFCYGYYRRFDKYINK